MKKLIYYLKLKYQIFVQDNKNFTNFYKKKFPSLYYLLPLIQIVSLISIMYFLTSSSAQYSIVFLSALESEEIFNDAVFLTDDQKFYHDYLKLFVCVYLASVLAHLLIAFYVIYNANHPIRDKFIQGTKHLAKATAAVSTVAVGYSYAPLEPTELSNFVHTKTPLGRGWDYEPGSMLTKVQGDIVSSKLGKDIMLEAVNIHAEDSKIINAHTLKKITNDPTFSSKLRNACSFSEARVIGLPLIDITSTLVKKSPSLSENLSEIITRDDDTIFDKTDDDHDHHDDSSSFPKLVDDQDKKDAERRGIRRLIEKNRAEAFGKSDSNLNQEKKVRFKED
jgi:hypothetical protein|uniref:Uncharacterized protein n=1 Tax=Nitzschia supralitorea TaxID=303403 RepID=A0A8F1B816_9STRA|nr:hypothetical protein KYU99_mgp06 [Nitzschia supralitorea]QWM93280.1 hypothetical protein [Nitzschia supralitorea]